MLVTKLDANMQGYVARVSAHAPKHIGGLMEYQVRWMPEAIRCCGQVIARFGDEGQPPVEEHGPYGELRPATATCKKCGSVYTADVRIRRAGLTHHRAKWY